MTIVHLTGTVRMNITPALNKDWNMINSASYTLYTDFDTESDS